MSETKEQTEAAEAFYRGMTVIEREHYERLMAESQFRAAGWGVVSGFFAALKSHASIDAEWLSEQSKKIMGILEGRAV